MGRLRTRKQASRNARDKQQSDQARQENKEKKKKSSSGLGLLAMLFNMQKSLGNQGTQETIHKKPEEDNRDKPPPPAMTPDYGIYMSPYSQERDTQAGYGSYRAAIRESLAEKEKEKEKKRDRGEEADFDEDADVESEDEAAESEAEDEKLGYADPGQAAAMQQAQFIQERRDEVLAELKHAATQAEQNRTHRTPAEMSKQLEAMEHAKEMLLNPSKTIVGRWSMDNE